jgi:acetamidase/formamidase
MLVLGLGFMLALVCVAALWVVFSLLRWLFTGRKPQVVVMMDSYKKWQQSGPWAARKANSEDIIDVQVRDLEPSRPPLALVDKKD